MDKKVLPVSDAAHIDQAAVWSRDLTRMRSRGPGDTENAMRQLEREYGIDYSALWSLRYRRDRLRKISKSIFDRIEAAYFAECNRQMRKLQHEIRITKVTEANRDLLAEAESFVRENNGKIKGS